MKLATIRVQDTEILSLACPRIDARAGLELVELVVDSVKRGARNVVLDLGPLTNIDFAGARALEVASRCVGDGGYLYLAGLNSRARMLLRSLRVAGDVRMIDWWTDALEPVPRAA